MTAFALHVKSMPMGAPMNGTDSDGNPTVHLADAGDTLIVVGTPDHHVCMMLPPEVLESLARDLRRCARAGRKNRRRGL